MNFFDFYAGIGGFRLGLEMAGHECVGHCEIDKYAHMSYMAMHRPKETEVYIEDIRTAKPRDIPDCDIYCGGFPCQAFSIAGRRRGFEDTRGTLFFEIMRIARERKPRLIFLENVKGLLNHEGGDTFETIITTMAELGYGVEWQVLNSKYFGVPQNRERVFIVGHLGGVGKQSIFPIIGKKDTTDLLQIAEYNTKRKNSNNYRLYSDKGIAPTIHASCGGAATPLVLHNNNIRRITPRECFRLQGFPDDYYERAAAVNSNSQLYKQAGNSVTVNVIYEIARRLK